ncbi:hypothetical protein SUGI_1140250 [Cryptomeria japonica]|uniref:laccase-22-like n=1 Tax=Cryptomeria japonica TaxID=3369 RepID=UPI002414A5D8|nr:laccase-22-like [Cryptomeria japonica]GLJ53456.1 hypothetical protein SUGI_1140250 [Cryptomeria japonica]
MADLSFALKLMVACIIFITPSLAFGALVQRRFVIGTQKVWRLCKEKEIVTVNGKFPGPTIYAHEGDNIVVEVQNNVADNITLHWHGVKQIRSCWADGPAYVTQCPITQGNSHTYNFTITEQEGTMWWHAHISYLRATVHGALITYPRIGKPYPFLKPAAEFPIILGEWWKMDVEEVIRKALDRGEVPEKSNAYTINGQPGNYFPCSRKETSKIYVEQGKQYLLRIVNAGLDYAFFFKIAKHRLTVVAMDASYTKPYKTEVILIQPGQTMDVLLNARQPLKKYQMAAWVYNSKPIDDNFTKTSATAILKYRSSRGFVPVSNLPPSNHTPTAYKFSTKLKSKFPSVPQTVDEEMFITEGFGIVSCPTCGWDTEIRAVGNFNNVSFLRPQQIDMLQAYYFGIDGVFTRDFPNNPPLEFNYTQDYPPPSSSSSSPPPPPPSFWNTQTGTKVKTLKFNSNVQIVFQGTSIVTKESHPIHIHGHDFYVVGQGFGNYNPKTDPASFNLVDPQILNTVGVPTGGWAAIRFQANNPGIWLVHCHFEAHSELGFAMVFLVENGNEESQRLPPPPPGLPQC